MFQTRQSYKIMNYHWRLRLVAAFMLMALTSSAALAQIQPETDPERIAQGEFCNCANMHCFRIARTLPGRPSGPARAVREFAGLGCNNMCT